MNWEVNFFQGKTEIIEDEKVDLTIVESPDAGKPKQTNRFVYNLKGKRVLSNEQRGIHIVNGKKVIRSKKTKSKL